MTPVELASLRNKVARARLGADPVPEETQTGYAAWTAERNAAGAAALDALHRACQHGQSKVAARRTRNRNRRMRRCVYCGDPGKRGNGNPVVCGSHADLVLLDPSYQAELFLRDMA